VPLGFLLLEVAALAGFAKSTVRGRLNAIAGATAIILVCSTAFYGHAAAQNMAFSPPIVPGERLSDWLVRNAGSNADTSTLHWRVSAERASQQRLRSAVVQSLQHDTNITLSVEERSNLATWLLALPLTGRLTVAIADPRWLQSAPNQDPILQEGHSVVLAPRSATVTVISDGAPPCIARHISGALIGDYLRACLGTSGDAQVDRAWVSQSDGRTASYGVAPWTFEAQAQPGLGSVIWAPRRNSGIPFNVSDNLSRFLATQLPGDIASTSARSQLVPGPTLAGTAPRPAQLTASDWGEIGLLQTPTARMAAAGDVRFQLSQVAPYTRGTVMFQPLDWLEAGFRYTDISNRLYGADIAGDQTFKDKSIDLKLRLRQESQYWPQIALGVRDLGGTGLFSAEYVVASKRWGNWDASLGLGWGYLGVRGNVNNPFGRLDQGFNSRPAADVGNGGTVNLEAMFRGPTAVFGGLQWHSPYDPWVFKLELDGNDYQREPLNNNQQATSPINVGAVFRYSPNIDFSIGFERGTRLMLGLTLHGGLNQVMSPKLLDPALPLVRPVDPDQNPRHALGETAQAIELYTGWSVRGITHDQITTTLVAETGTALHLQARVERAIRVLHRDAPATSNRFVLLLRERGLPMSQITVERQEWLAQHMSAEPPALRLPAIEALAGAAIQTEPAVSDVAPQNYWRGKQAGFSLGWGPSYTQSLGGPDGFLLYQLGLEATAEYRFSDRTWLSGTLNQRLLDNYKNFNYTGPSELPRVRTFIREYLTTSASTLPLLQLTHVAEMGNGHYFSAYGGMLESMFGGVGAEWLYRPWRGPLAFGVDVNHVRQRDFAQNFAFRDYTATTGHATAYWDTGWNDVQINLSVGRYLAGDVGGTVDVKRVFSNGIALGAWATKTNVSAEQFGEGSFDKGIYVSIPFDVMLPRSTAGIGTIAWNPLTRDGGARLNRAFTLYDLTRQRDSRALQWRETDLQANGSAEARSYVLNEPRPGLFDGLGGTTRTLGRQIADIPGSTWLWAGGAILASTLLDKSIDQWAQNSPEAGTSTLANTSNGLPLALALGAGLMYTGIGGEAAQSTAETAIKAAGYTLGANLMTRFVVGRSRPYQEQGNGDFNGLNTTALGSGFASNHVAVAFALATPFARQHDMPWLYAVAGASAIGRIEQRDHWLSDTVAGAFMGYAFGAMLSEQQRGDKGMRLSVTPNSVVANWTFK
jgi:membrane-associated phospholipid phosphatase